MQEKEIEDMIAFLDGTMEKGVSRLKVQTSEELEEGQIVKQYHHGRCDVGSPWAKGTVSNCDAIDS